MNGSSQRTRCARKVACVALAGVSLAACAADAPTSPSVLALPREGEGFALFQQHETTCRQYASAQTGGVTPGQADAKSGIGGAVLGTGLGAAAGALLGSASGHAGTGAAIGAGSGLLAGGLLGSARGRQAAEGLQERYDTSYEQCMAANGEQIPPPAATVVYGVPPPPVYMAPPVFVPAPVYAPPAVYLPPPAER